MISHLYPCGVRMEVKVIVLWRVERHKNSLTMRRDKKQSIHRTYAQRFMC